MDKEFRKQGRALREISYIDRLRYVGNNAMGSLSFSPQESEEFIGKSLEIIGIEKLNQNALAIFEEDSHDVLETLNRIASSGGSRPKGNLYFSKDLRLCNESWQPSFDGWIVKFKTHSTVLASEEGVCEYTPSWLSRPVLLFLTLIYLSYLILVFLPFRDLIVRTKEESFLRAPPASLEQIGAFPLWIMSSLYALLIL